MNRRSFVRAIAGLLSVFPVLRSVSMSGSVQVVKYVDPKYLGQKFNVVGKVKNPPVMNEHYRPGEQLIAIQSGGILLHVYQDEIVSA